MQQSCGVMKQYGKSVFHQFNPSRYNILTASKSVNANLNLPSAMLADARL